MTNAEEIRREIGRLTDELQEVERPIHERLAVARTFAFALDGLIRSRTKGDGGDEYARKCIDKIAEAIEKLTR